KPLHRFPMKKEVAAIALSPDERSLFIGWAEGGHFGVWDVPTGRLLWQEAPFSYPNLGYVYDASFAADRKTPHGRAARLAPTYQPRTGRRVGCIQFPVGKGRIYSAALSPDGSRGALVKSLDSVFTFDVRTAEPKDTGWKAGSAIRYSADGRYLVCSSPGKM